MLPRRRGRGGRSRGSPLRSNTSATLTVQWGWRTAVLVDVAVNKAPKLRLLPCVHSPSMSVHKAKCERSAQGVNNTGTRAFVFPVATIQYRGAFRYSLASALVWTLRERQARRRSRVERAGGPCNPVLGRPRLHVGWRTQNTRLSGGEETRDVIDVSGSRVTHHSRTLAFDSIPIPRVTINTTR